MAKKTNKTTHVLDLLTNGGPQENKSDVQSHTVTPSTVTVVDEGSRNDRLSQEILTKLSEELEDEVRQESGAQAPQEPQKAPTPAPEEDTSAAPEPQPEAPADEAGSGQYPGTVQRLPVQPLQSRRLRPDPDCTSVQIRSSRRLHCLPGTQLLRESFQDHYADRTDQSLHQSPRKPAA